MKVIFTKSQILAGSVWLQGSTSPEMDEPLAQDLIDHELAKPAEEIPAPPEGKPTGKKRGKEK